MFFDGRTVRSLLEGFISSPVSILTILMSTVSSSPYVIVLGDVACIS